MEWALIALASAGFQMFQQHQQQAIAQEARVEGSRRASANQNRMVQERLARMRGTSSGTVLGGTPLGQARQASQQGSILSNANTQSRSLLGNTL